MFIAFWCLLSFLRRNKVDVRYTILKTILVKITLVCVNERVVAN